MKTNKVLLISLAAGAVVAGLAAYFFYTEQGKELKGKWMKKGTQLAKETRDVLKEAKGRMDAMKSEMCEEKINDRKYAETPVG
jgi:gas vesicle protein